MSKLDDLKRRVNSGEGEISVLKKQQERCSEELRKMGLNFNSIGKKLSIINREIKDLEKKREKLLEDAEKILKN